MTDLQIEKRMPLPECRKDADGSSRAVLSV